MKSSKVIKRIRLELLKSREEFASMVGVSVQSIGNYENSMRQPKLSIVKKLIDIAKKNKIDVMASDFFD